jgi:hypothetical protein
MSYAEMRPVQSCVEEGLMSHLLSRIPLLSAAVVSATLTATGCNRSNGPPEVYENGSGAIKESDIRARLMGGGVELEFPLKRIEQGVLKGELSVSLVDISNKDEVLINQGSASFTQNGDLENHDLTLSRLPADLERAKTAPMVIRWSIKLPQGELRGKKSLYAALGKVEIELRGGTEIPEGGSVPFRVIARDPDSLAPRIGATVNATFIAPDGTSAPLFTGTTDARGELAQNVSLPSGAEQGTLRVDVSAADAEAWTKAAVSVTHPRKIALSTDKTIYKPGQTIELRALALNTTQKTPLVGEDVVIEALDGRGNKVFKKHATTDAFGVAAMEVITDAAVNEGTWTLRATITGGKAEIQLPVTTYNLPKMKVTVSADKEYAQTGGTITGKVSALYMFGLPVSGANISVSLRTKDGTVLVQQSSAAGPDGSLAFSLSVPQNLPQPQGQGTADVPAGGRAAPAVDSVANGDVSLEVHADVTDGAGQTESGSTVLPLSDGALVIKALPEAGALLPGVENIVYFIVSDPLGRPIVATLALDGVGPIAPLSTDANGVAELHFTPSPGADSLTLSINATDGAGRTQQRSVTLQTSKDGVLIVRTDKAIYRVGETAMVSVLTSASSPRAYLDVYKGGAGLQSNALDMNGGASTLMLPIGDAMRGVLILDAFTLGGSGTVIRGTQRILIDPEDRLDIQLSTDNTTYAPGQPATVSVTVKDSAGNPAVASLGLYTVDEAVFALGGEPNDDIHTLFNLDPRILPPTISVLGQTASDLFAAQSLESEDLLAKLLFASAKDVAGPALDYNSIRAELPAVISSLEGRVQRDGIAFLKSIAGAYKGQQLTREMATDVARRASGVYDPFGERYAATPDTQIWSQLKFTSAGPDEKMNTGDDVTTSFDFGWITWADPSDVDDIGLVHGGFAFGAEGGDRNNAAGTPAQAPPTAPAPAPDTKSMAPGPAPVKVRSDFRETVYTNPTLITGADGRATVTFPLAQSITSWRIRAQGSTQNGKLGSARLDVKTFQEFFVDFDVPTTFTRNDVVELSAVVYNYLPTPQTVAVHMDQASWIDILSSADQSLTLNPSEVRSVKFTVRAKNAGAQQLSIHASAGSVSDALVRDANVKPDGLPEDQSFSDKLNGTKDYTITIPADAIAGGTTVELTVTPGFAGEAVQGMEGLLKEPGGCFEQTTSSAWPNTLVTNYLQITNQLTPDLQDKAFGLVTRGYQRLLKFESPTGGFNWWGNNDPGNRILSAIMLWHLKDMEPIIETDDAVRQRTLTWLLAQQRADGSWASGDALHAGDEILGTSDIRTTAFIAWALAHTGWATDAVNRAADYLRGHQPDASDVYANALAANALAVVDAGDSVLSSLFARLDGIKSVDSDGHIKWTSDVPSWTGAGGDVGAIETTSLIAYGLLKARAYPDNASGAIGYLVAHKDSVGSWYNTQATMNSLRALVAAASPQGSEAVGTLGVSVNGQALPAIALTKANSDVYQKVDLLPFMQPGSNTVSLNMQGTGQVTYHLARRAYRPTQVPPANGPLSLVLTYDSATPSAGQSVGVHTIASYTGPGTMDQVMVRIGRAPGFAPRTDDLDQLVSRGAIARYEIDDSFVTMYLMGLHTSEARVLDYHVTPTLAATAVAPASAIYKYYDRTIRMDVAPISFNVADR